MSDTCEICGLHKKNKACEETLLDYLENPKVITVESGEHSRKVLLDSGGSIFLSDCDVCNIRKVKYVLGD